MEQLIDSTNTYAMVTPGLSCRPNLLEIFVSTLDHTTKQFQSLAITLAWEKNNNEPEI